MLTQQTQTGVTLIELIIVVIIMAIMLSLVIPAFQEIMDRNRLKAATEGLYSDLQFAKVETIKRNKRMRINFASSDGGATWCYGIRENADCDCTVDSGADLCHIDNVPRVVRSTDFPGVSIEPHISSPGDRFTFDNVRGIMDSTFGYVGFNSSGQKQTRVIVSRLGRIRYCSPAGNTNVTGYSTSC